MNPIVRIVHLVVGAIWYVLGFIRGFVTEGTASFWWSFRAGMVLGERRSLTGQTYDRQDIYKLARRMRADQQMLREHRRKYGR